MSIELAALLAIAFMSASLWIPFIVGVNMTPAPEGAPSPFVVPPDPLKTKPWVARSFRAHQKSARTVVSVRNDDRRRDSARRIHARHTRRGDRFRHFADYPCCRDDHRSGADAGQAARLHRWLYRHTSLDLAGLYSCLKARRRNRDTASGEQRSRRPPKRRILRRMQVRQD